MMNTINIPTDCCLVSKVKRLLSLINSRDWKSYDEMDRLDLLVMTEVKVLMAENDIDIPEILEVEDSLEHGFYDIRCTDTDSPEVCNFWFLRVDPVTRTIERIDA
jgi:glutamate synthase domain-containing protein 1